MQTATGLRLRLVHALVRRMAGAALALTWLPVWAVAIDSIDVGDTYYVYRSMQDNSLVVVLAVDRVGSRVKVRYDTGAVDWIAPGRLLTQSEADQSDDQDSAQALRLFGCLLDAQSCKDEPWTPGVAQAGNPHVISGDKRDTWHPAAGYSWDDPDSKAMSVHWTPGRRHPSAPHVFAGANEGRWQAGPGYDWDDPNDMKSMAVHWSPGKVHASLAHVVAATNEGKWLPEPGYEWVTPGKFGPVAWSPGRPNSGNSEIVAGSTPGKWQPAAGFRWKNPDKPGDYAVVPK